MLSARLCKVAGVNPYRQHFAVVKSAVGYRSVNLLKSTPLTQNNGIRLFMENNRQRLSHSVRRKTLAEQLSAPAGDTAFTVGRGAVAGGALLGIGALCYYGLGLSSKPGILESSVFWPAYVKERIRSTYMYFGGSILVSVASAAAVFRSPALFDLVTRGGVLSMVVTLGALIGSGLILQSIPYSPGFGTKQLAWIGHSALIGAVLAPMALVGGPTLIKAAWYTAGVVGGLSTIAVCAPNEKFLQMGGILAAGLGVVFASSIGAMFLPPTTAFGSTIHSIVLFGGLLLFSGFLLYDTQRIVYVAQHYPPDYTGVKPFDPINASVSIYLDVINIFIRLVTILSGNGGSKKR